jgi:regulator of sigma E protease
VLRAGDRSSRSTARGDTERSCEQIATHRCAGEPTTAAAPPSREGDVLRDGRERTAAITPVYSAELERPLLGFSYGNERVFEPVDGVPAAVGKSFDYSWFVTTATVTTIAGIFEAEKRKEISGIVGSYETTRQAIKFSTELAVLLLALISLSLGVINLFPFLPLDGGHIFWAVAEKVRGRAIPFSVMERAGFVGFALVIGLFLVGLTNDIGRLTGEGFGVR